MMDVDEIVRTLVVWLPGCNELDPYTPVSHTLHRKPPECRGLIHYTLATTPPTFKSVNHG